MECCRVLIADDNVRARLGLRVLLSTWPEVEVVGEAADGQAVLDMVRDRQPDVVVMDVCMPRIGGLEVACRLKSRWPAMGIVLTSLDAAQRVKALAAGADRFLVKGCPPEELRGAILQPAIPGR